MSSHFITAQFSKFKKMKQNKEKQFQKIPLQFQVLKIVNPNKMMKRKMTSQMKKT